MIVIILKNDDYIEEQKLAIKNLGDVINSDLNVFESKFNTHLDKQNMIDMMLFIEAIGDWDAVSQDLEVVTYDLNKFYFMPWDKDTTFGLWWDGTGIIENYDSQLTLNYDSEKIE